MRMKPSPTLQWLSTDTFIGRFCDLIVSGRGIDFIKVRMYSNIVEVPLDLLGDLVGELPVRDRQAVPSPAQCVNLTPRG